MLALFILNLIPCVWIVCHAAIELEHLSTVYLPSGYSPQEYQFDAEVAEQCAVDTRHHYVYVAGYRFIHTVDFSNPSSASLVDHVEFPEDAALNDIETCGEWVAIVYSSIQTPLKGRAIILTAYNGTQGSMTILHDIEVGATPDSLKFSSDCGKVLVAIEGELVNNNGVMVDHEGGVTVVEFEGGQPGAGEPTVTFVNFTKFNDMSEDYISRGVRKVYNGQNTADITSTTFSQDLEPENVAINADNTMAYITLQENNAIALLNITEKEFVEIYPLGYKDYGEGKADMMDASDKDGGAHIQNWGTGMSSLLGMYQPDGIKLLRFEGKEYLLSASEGDVKEYEEIGLQADWTEAMRGKDIVNAGRVGVNVSDDFRALLSNDSLLGRLTLSLVDGLDREGNIERFMAYGGRSISLHRTSDMSLAWDSGSDLEQKILNTFPEVFNGDADADEKPEDTFDSRSDNKGPEPDSVEYGVVNGKTVVFVGVERPGIIAVYSIVPDSDLQLQFENIYYHGGQGDTFEQLWQDRTARDLEPEDLRFIPSASSPWDSPLLIVAGAVSGTVSFYSVMDSVASTTTSSQVADQAWASQPQGILAIISLFSACCCQYGL